MEQDLNKQLKMFTIEKIHQLTVLSADDQLINDWPVIKEFMDLFLEDRAVFQHLYDTYRYKLESIDIVSQDIDLYYRIENGKHTIAFLDKKLAFDEAFYVQFLSYSIEIMREVLPLGSVVELDPRFFESESASSATKVVITKRFIAPKNFQSYFPYAGVVYPVGQIKKEAEISFTYPLIKRVIHHGFKDEQEEAFELLMKKELILEKSMRSIEFSHVDMRKLQEAGEIR
ncbi:DUF4176 domain-containing protein [Bacillus carboniphilus]|uniref:DUF4176 domain-containing protein n=1 Tax=Bacillus carboniphilus TaxID=86663 RepID=A0ABY9JVR7_9BACI|nr:DUF4176 domain-containing protein [Bacillus carboniphilus]WLR42583.1 DUF4176 domain-containing protein [Bacillus carboniphilus]